MTIVGDTVAWLSDPANWAGPGSIPQRLLEHIGLSAIALAVAIVLALPAGLAIGHTRRGAAFAATLANIGRAVPSLALMGIVLPLTTMIDPQLGFKVYPVLIAMTILAIPPILVNAEAGVAGVDPDLVESARGMGMREGQVLGRVEIPVAVPVILAGIRSGATQIVATMTLAAIFGGGGLGRFLVEGIAQRDDPMLYAGSVLVAALALATDAAFALVQRFATSPGLRRVGERVTARSSIQGNLPT